MTKLSELLGKVFDEDVRNAVAHADYVIWETGLRVRKRNGGQPREIEWKEFSEIVARGAMFFGVLRELQRVVIQSYYPPKFLLGKLSASPLMKWPVAYDPQSGSFSFRSESPGARPDEKFERAEAIRSVLAGGVASIFCVDRSHADRAMQFFLTAGIEPRLVVGDGAELREPLQVLIEVGLLSDFGPAGACIAVTPLGVKIVNSDTPLSDLIPEIEGIEIVGIEPGGSPE